MDKKISLIDLMMFTRYMNTLQRYQDGEEFLFKHPESNMWYKEVHLLYDYIVTNKIELFD